MINQFFLWDVILAKDVKDFLWNMNLSFTIWDACPCFGYQRHHQWLGRNGIDAGIDDYVSEEKENFHKNK